MHVSMYWYMYMYRCIISARTYMHACIIICTYVRIYVYLFMLLVYCELCGRSNFSTFFTVVQSPVNNKDACIYVCLYICLFVCLLFGIFAC